MIASGHDWLDATVPVASSTQNTPKARMKSPSYPDMHKYHLRSPIPTASLWGLPGGEPEDG
jgi:hypothetical protein